MSHPRLPNFFIVGAGKAGTTSLHHYLQQHPQVYMSPVKEPCYFAAEIRGETLGKAFEKHVRRQSANSSKPLGHLVDDWDDYLALFENAGPKIAIGEASAAYLWSETAAANIHARIPDARILMMLRDPAERAFSQYLHQLATGLTKSTFREHIEACLRNRSRELGIYYPFLEVGLYTQQVRRFLDLFPRDHIRIDWFEEAWRDTARLMRELFEFLGVDAGFHPDTARRHLARRAPRWPALNYFLKESDLWYPFRAMVPAGLRPRLQKLVFRPGKSLRLRSEDRQYLVDYYRDDIQQLSALLDRDLSSWLRVGG